MSKKILIVDDDESILEALEDLFLTEGFEVKIAADGLKAIDCLKDFLPNVILIDQNMPGMTGLEFIESKKKGPDNLKDIPVILFSAQSRTKVKMVDGITYLSKPVDVDVLLSTVESFL